MFIQEIIIDGFKSYAHRTVVQGFDPHFNAITGLNGSGKSNILDSICFVLGITNLSQVRAGNLSELVYKQGQAGVNKASVTIVFNNSDPETSPVGFEQCNEVTVTRQVLLGGKSKYMINGRNAQAGAVQNLFHSVQLNVNNPHFLIMQGRITKVLNMRSHEILGMVEEAAGTRMYENKRVNALKTIEKKQAKLDEINGVLEEEITPTLDRLRGEKQNYLKWSKNSADLERLERFCVAHQFHSAKTALEDNNEGVASMQNEANALSETEESLRNQVKEKEELIEKTMGVLTGDLGGQLEKTKKLAQKRSNDLVRETSKWKNSRETIEQAQKDLEAARNLVNETKDAITEKQSEMYSTGADGKDVVEAAAAAERELQNLAEEYQKISAGISVENRSLPEQISKAHSDSKTAEARIQQAQMKITHLSKELKVVEKEIKKEGRSAEQLAAKKEQAASKVTDLQDRIASLNFSDEEFDAYEERKTELESEVAELSERLNTLRVRLNGRLNFEYSDPVRGFDRSKVKGMVASLVKVNSSEYSVALEVVAGGKLFQVIVQDAVTAKALLGRGKLKKRCTIIPLDKIQGRHISASTIQTANTIAQCHGTTATLAIDLVGFDEENRSAMEFVFGSSIVAAKKEAAEQICFTTKTRTITLEGDTYDPSGTVSGGSKGNFGTTLSQLVELAELGKSLEDKNVALREIVSKLNAMGSSKTSFEKLSSELNFAQATLNAAEKHLSQTSFGLLIEKRDSYTSGLSSASQEIEEMTKEMEEKWKLYETLKEQEGSLTKQREERILHIEDAVEKAKVVAAEKTKLAREAESKEEVISLELENLKKELAAATEAVSGALSILNEAIQAERQTQSRVEETQTDYEEARRELEQLQENASARSQEVGALKQEIADLNKQAEEAKLGAKKLVVSITRIRKDREVAEKTISSMLKKYAWIEGEMSAFGVTGGDYDFEVTSPAEALDNLHNLKSEQDSLSKRINKKVMGMIEKAEGEYNELLRKRAVVEKDKKKIQDVIQELDVKKKTELEITWQKVNTDFGSVFSTLLPGARAKLEPPEGMDATEGLEVKVAFGDEWKQSLTELSGGQRSLLALSLILALLLFKPAPMYILDEVDAALDLSHTQNIGNMLKTHFSQSQFIVVSLKEGMFNNANVIFRTKFVDGVSTVTRTIGAASRRSTPRLSAASANESEGEHLDSAAVNDKPSSRRNKTKRGKENSLSMA